MKLKALVPPVLFVLKVLCLAFVAAMAASLLPELRYDFGGANPVEIGGPADLEPGRYRGSVFVSVRGRPDFSKAFSYRRYGLSFTYFNVEPYGPALVARTYERVGADWYGIDRFLGRLRPFAEQPFSYRIREIYEGEMGVEIPDGAYFLALDDVPEPSWWQAGGLVFSLLLWGVLFWLFFVRRPFRGRA